MTLKKQTRWSSLGVRVRAREGMKFEESHTLQAIAEYYDAKTIANNVELLR